MSITPLLLKSKADTSEPGWYSFPYAVSKRSKFIM
jgi:hypothetical protein